MKLTIALLAIFAVSCVFSAPTNLKSFKSLSQARMNGRLHSGHKTVQTMFAHPSKNVHHVALKRNQIKQNQVKKHLQTSPKIIREEVVALKNGGGFFMSSQTSDGKTSLGGNFDIKGTEKFTILYLEDGKVALKTPQGTYIRTRSTGAGALVDVASSIGDWEKYDLIKHSDGTLSFKSAHNNYLRIYKTDEGPTVLDTQTDINVYEKYAIVDPSTGLTEQTVALKTSEGYYVRASPAGSSTNLGASLVLGATEILTMVTVQSGMVAFRTPQGTYIRTRSTGAGALVDVASSIGPHEIYEPIKNSDGSVSFKTYFNNYLRIQKKDDGRLFPDTQTYIGRCEKFTVLNSFSALKEQTGALKTVHGTFVSVRPEATEAVATQKTEKGDTEKLTLVTLLSGKVAIRTAKGAYLSVHSENPLAPVDSQAKIDDHATFDLVQNSDGSISFKSFQGTYLRADEGGEGADITTQAYNKDWEHFTPVGLDAPAN